MVANPSTPRPTHQHSRVSRYCCCYLTRNRQRNCERLICLAYFYLLAYADALDALRIRFPLVERPLLINSPTSATRSILSHSFGSSISSVVPSSLAYHRFFPSSPNNKATSPVGLDLIPLLTFLPTSEE